MPRVWREALGDERASVGPMSSTEIEAQSLSASPRLAAGRYTRAGFEPRITFEVSDGAWAAVQLFDGFFDIQQDVGSPDVLAVQFCRPAALVAAGLEPVA